MNGDELRVIREQLDMTQFELAKRLQVAPLTVLRWENNQVVIAETVALAVKQIQTTGK